MTITALDTHQTVKDLTAAGFSDSQAEALTQVIRRVQDIDLSNLATKADLAELRLATKADLGQGLAELRAELLKWFIGVVFAQAAVVLALVKLFAGGHS
ncbi:MAG TPA: hypothetical protein VG308_07735 [Stellaceae bacterium]|jgi:hypothetical protein|nr:hypothetical protein [Stellaceae bacterium]